MKTSDTLSLSYRTVKSNRLRTGITVTIIALGIMALIGIITAIKAMNQSLKENFSILGANAFSIRYKGMNINIGGRKSRVKQYKRGEKKDKTSNVGKSITEDQAILFKENYKFPSLVGIQLGGPRQLIAKYENLETTPQVSISGGDESFLGRVF
jgi:putative ABC transport system permease protein